jgi:hypothetical protein
METSSSKSSTQALKTVGWTLYNHKFKIIFLLGLGYTVKKLYDLYVFVKPFLDLKNQLTGTASNAGSSSAQRSTGAGGALMPPEAELTES